MAEISENEMAEIFEMEMGRTIAIALVAEGLTSSSAVILIAIIIS